MASSGVWLLLKRFIYQGWNLIAEYQYQGDTLVLQATHHWGLDIAGTLTATGGVGALVRTSVHAGADAGKTYHYGHDANGNVTVVLDTNGTLAAAYEYSPYGELLRKEGPRAASNPWRFSSKYADDETSLVYYGRRYYSPRTGRFLNQDPIGEQGGLNLYAFVRNSPVNAVDVLGLDAYNGMEYVRKEYEYVSDDCIVIYDIYRSRVSFEEDRIPVERKCGMKDLGWLPKMTVNGNENTPPLPPLPPAIIVVGTVGGNNGGSTSGGGGDASGGNPPAPQPPQKPPCNQAPVNGAQEKNTTPTTDNRITYTGQISYKAGALILGYGRFTGTVTSNTTPAQTYQITGRIDGVGIQIGYITGTANVTFMATSPEGMLGSNGGFWTLSVGLGAGPLRALSGDVTINAHNTGLDRAEFGDISPDAHGPGVDTDVSALDGKNMKPGVGFSGAFWGTTVQTVTPCQ